MRYLHTVPVLIQKLVRASIDEFHEGIAINTIKAEVTNASKPKKIDDLSSDSGKSVASPPSTELRTITSGPIISITSTIPDPDNDISDDQPKSSEPSNNHGYNNSSPTLHIGISEESTPASGIRRGSYTTDGLSKLDIQQDGDKNEEDERTIGDADADVIADKKQKAANCLKRKRGNESEDEYTDEDSEEEEIPHEDTKPVLEVPDEEDLADM
jgi:hypothetical protein